MIATTTHIECKTQGTLTEIDDVQVPFQMLYNMKLSCPICFENTLGQNMIFSNNCSHFFCKECTMRLPTQACPLCRCTRFCLYIVDSKSFMPTLYEFNQKLDVEPDVEAETETEIEIEEWEPYEDPNDEDYTPQPQRRRISRIRR